MEFFSVDSERLIEACRICGASDVSAKLASRVEVKGSEGSLEVLDAPRKAHTDLGVHLHDGRHGEQLAPLLHGLVEVGTHDQVDRFLDPDPAQAYLFDQLQPVEVFLATELIAARRVAADGEVRREAHQHQRVPGVDVVRLPQFHRVAVLPTVELGSDGHDLVADRHFTEHRLQVAALVESLIRGVEHEVDLGRSVDGRPHIVASDLVERVVERVAPRVSDPHRQDGDPAGVGPDLSFEPPFHAAEVGRGVVFHDDDDVADAGPQGACDRLHDVRIVRPGPDHAGDALKNVLIVHGSLIPVLGC